MSVPISHRVLQVVAAGCAGERQVCSRRRRAREVFLRKTFVVVEVVYDRVYMGGMWRYMLSS